MPVHMWFVRAGAFDHREVDVFRNLQLRPIALKRPS